MAALRSSIQPTTNPDAKPVAPSRQGARATQEVLPFREEALIISDFSNNFIEFQFEEIRLRDYIQARNGLKFSDTLMNCTLDTALLPHGDANDTLKLMNVLDTTNIWDTDVFYDNYFTVTPTLRNLSATERPAEVTAPTISFKHQIDPQEQHALVNNTNRMIYNTYMRSQNQYATTSMSQLNTSGLDVDRSINTAAHLDLTTSTIAHRSTLAEEITNCEHIMNQHLSQNLLNKGMDAHQRLEAAGIEKLHHGYTLRTQKQPAQYNKGSSGAAPNSAGATLNTSTFAHGSSRPSTANSYGPAMHGTTTGTAAVANSSSLAAQEEKLNELWRSALQPELGVI